MSQQRKRSLLQRIIADHRERPWSKVAALVLTISLGAGVLVQAGQKESPIRVSLPGFVPEATALPELLPQPVPSKPQPIPRGVQTRKAAAKIGPSATVSQPPAALPPAQVTPRSTAYDIDQFTRSLQWSLHSGVVAPRLPARSQRVQPSIQTPLSPSKLTTAAVPEQLTPTDAPTVAPTVAPTALSPSSTIPQTLFDREQFEQSIAKSKSTLQDVTTVSPIQQQTQYQTDAFVASMKGSLADVGSSVETTINLPATATAVTPFDAERFLQSVESANASTPMPAVPTTPIVTTDFDLSRFNEFVQSSVANPTNTVVSPARTQTTFDGSRFSQSLESSLQERPLPQTIYDANQFHKSIDRSLRQPTKKESIDRPETRFKTARFENSVKATLANARLPIVPRATDQAAKKKAEWESGQPCNPRHPLNDFSPTPVDSRSLHHDPNREALPYDAKRNVPTQRPWIEWGREFYGDGITPRGLNIFGAKNMVRPKFYMYGDYPTGVSAGRNAQGRTDNWAHRLNLDMDFQITDTERFHAFVGPLDQGNQFTRLQLVDGDFQWREEINFTPLTGFFEGDLGVMMGAAHNQSSPHEIPFTIGLVPLLFQNGIWMEDAVTGAAVAIPAQHSRLLNWSNYDATFFAVFDQLNSVAFAGDEHAAQAFGTAWFIEAYGGYIESGYAYVRDRNRSELSYHNITTSFTRRYFDRISNSVRVIVNAGQDLPAADRTADGVLLLAENSWITRWPLTVVPYANFFVGWDRPQSVARAAASGGILRNTGINFDTDGLNGFATLDPTASDTAGFSLGVDLIGDDLDRQLLLEFSYVSPHGDKNPVVKEDQYAIGSRYQFPISHRTLLRFDTMYGWRGGLADVYGTRMEYRWKF